VAEWRQSVPRRLAVPNEIWFWLVAGVAAVLPILFGSAYLLGVCVLFAIYAATNLMWSLVIGCAGIGSLATLAILGGAAYAGAYVAVRFDLPWIALVGVATVAGAVGGVLVAVPAMRLRGIYFALLTMGLVQLANTFVQQSRALGSSQGIPNVPGFVPLSEIGTRHGNLIGYYGGLVLVAACLIVYWLVSTRRLGLILRAARDSEPVAGALGINFALARTTVFLISSTMLGLIGGFYAAFYRSITPSIFSFDLLLILLAMMVVGGLASARGILLGTALLLFIDQRFITAGPRRFVAIGILMLLITLFANEGLAGLPAQLRAFVRRRRAQRVTLDPSKLTSDATLDPITGSSSEHIADDQESGVLGVPNG
jgi:branched-chain amino acid transport system permease protein